MAFNNSDAIPVTCVGLKHFLNCLSVFASLVDLSLNQNIFFLYSGTTVKGSNLHLNFHFS